MSPWVQRLSGKWGVPCNDYPFDSYPNFCQGNFRVTNIPSLRLLYKAARKLRYFGIDDALITGLANSEARVQLFRFPKQHVNIMMEKTSVWTKWTKFDPSVVAYGMINPDKIRSLHKESKQTKKSSKGNQNSLTRPNA